jgi:serine/threonine protein phosphatase PrpC
MINLGLKSAFERTTRDLYTSGIDITFSGATTVSVIVLENEIWCANIGDSRAVIIMNNSDNSKSRR